MTLVLQSVILPGGKTHEGVLVESVGIIWKEFMRLYAADPNIFYQIDPRSGRSLSLPLTRRPALTR